MKDRKIPTKYKIVALILVLLLVVPLLIPVFNSVFAQTSTSAVSPATSVSSGLIVNYYKITDPNTGEEITELTKDSKAFDLTVGLLDQNVDATTGFQKSTSFAVLESTSFYGETTNTGTLVQTGSDSAPGPMKLKASFKNVKFNGQTNSLTIRVGYTVEDEPKNYVCSFMVSQISLEKEEEKKDPAPPPSPRVVIDECTYGGDVINTDQTFTLSFSYFNASSAVKMENLKIEVNGGENFVIKNNSNTFFVEELVPKGIKNQTVDFTALKSIKEDSSYPIEIRFSYEYVVDYTRKAGEDVTKIYIPVHKVVEPPRLTISDISCSPSEIEEEEESTITVQIANKGESEVKNVSVSISGNLKSESYVREIGTIASGRVTAPTFKITTLPAQTTLSAEGATVKIPVSNKITGNIVVAFEDEEGNQHTIDRSFGLNVNVQEEENFGDEMMQGIPDDVDMGEEEEMIEEGSGKKMNKFMVIGLISGGVILVGGGSFLVYKKIKKKKEELLDEDI